MGAITPNSKIYLLRNIPLDTTYGNTIWFANKSAQTTYFSKQAKYKLDKYTYQRVNSNILRVQVLADQIYDCNYLMFQNTNHGDKWFYAFIKRIDYVNEVTSEIEYELDVMQTWFFDFSLEESFVEREHTATDNIFEWIQDEGLETGPYLEDSSGGIESDNFKEMIALVMSTTLLDGSDPQPAYGEVDAAGGIYNKTYSGACIYGFDTFEKYKKFFNGVQSNGTQDGVVCAYMAPKAFVDTSKQTLVTGINTENKGKEIMIPMKSSGGISGYTPKNKKLYCYPYNFLTVTTGDGNGQDYRYEFFTKDYGNMTCIFTEYCTCLPNPVGVTAPRNYALHPGVDFNNAVSLNSFPMCGYSIDTYKAWIAQNAGAQTVTTVSNAVAAGIGGFALGGWVGAGAAVATSLASQVGGLLAQNVKQEVLPPMHGGKECSDVLSMRNKKTFRYRNRHITQEYAKMIDDYFTMFGYAIKQVKVPNIHVRPYWTYCKTLGCNIRGSIPADDAKKICQIFDNGVTHWTSGDVVGNYSLNNGV